MPSGGLKPEADLRGPRAGGVDSVTELCDLTGTELITKFRQGKASPTEAMESCLARIASVEPDIAAVLTLRNDQALRDARLSTKRWRSGTERLLEGIPFGVKDIIFTAGIRTTGGSKIYGDFVPDESATVVKRLQRHHAILLAKLQTYEFAMGDNSHYGPTRNPWNLAHTTGGSSSGPAAALAARELPISIGTDTTGSMRGPATLCGVCALNPTPGLISRHGVMPLSWTLDRVGPMARSVEDIALVLTAVAGYDARDPTSYGPRSTDYLSGLNDGIKGLRLGLPADYFFDLVDPEVERATRAAANILAKQGATIVDDITFPHIGLAEALGVIIVYAEHASLQEGTLSRFTEYSRPISQEVLAAAPFMSALDYTRALRARHLVQMDFEAAFETVDALVVPGMVSIAPRLADMSFHVADATYDWFDVVSRMAYPFSVSGVPSLALPAGLHSSGLPIGIQIAARPRSDMVCLKIGQAYQKVTDHHLAIPRCSSRGL
jgi:aspartyl-tRNA(Asn)/glutamyl-tRNA(Gln) amidotransferase subunit A